MYFWNVEQRLQSVEAQQEDLRRTLDEDRKHFWLQVLQALAPIVVGFGVAYVGYALNSAGDAIAASQKERALNLTAAEGMRDQLLVLNRQEDPDPDQRAAAAMVLALAYPNYASSPLMALFPEDPELIAHALTALLGNARLTEENHSSLCESLVHKLDHSDGSVPFAVHRSAVKLLGEGRCSSGVAVLQKYAAMLGPLRRNSGATSEEKRAAVGQYNSTVDSDQELKHLRNLLESIDTSLERIADREAPDRGIQGG